MTLIYINTRFPKTKKAYAEQAKDNTDELKKIMAKLLIQEEPKAAPVKAPVAAPRQGGFISYADRRRSEVARPQSFGHENSLSKRKAKTFKL